MAQYNLKSGERVKKLVILPGIHRQANFDELVTTWKVYRPTTQNQTLTH